MSSIRFNAGNFSNLTFTSFCLNKILRHCTQSHTESCSFTLSSFSSNSARTEEKNYGVRRREKGNVFCFSFDFTYTAFDFFDCFFRESLFFYIWIARTCIAKSISIVNKFTKEILNAIAICKWMANEKIRVFDPLIDDFKARVLICIFGSPDKKAPTNSSFSAEKKNVECHSRVGSMERVLLAIIKFFNFLLSLFFDWFSFYYFFRTSDFSSLFVFTDLVSNWRFTNNSLFDFNEMRICLKTNK